MSYTIKINTSDTDWIDRHARVICSECSAPLARSATAGTPTMPVWDAAADGSECPSGCGHAPTPDAVAYGTDIKGVMYFTTTVEVGAVEHVTFAGAQMVRFDIGDDAPADHNRHAMYPLSYLVSEK